MVAKIQGHSNPFRDEITRLTVPQIDFILEMTAIEKPKEYTFVRPSKQSRTPDSLAAWHRIYEGGALSRFLGKMVNTAASRKARAVPPGIGLRGTGAINGLSLDIDGIKPGL